MGALVLCGVAATCLLIRWWHSGLKLFDYVMLKGVLLFARLWHRCSHLGQLALPATGPAMLISNHANHSDPAFLASGCPRLPGFFQAREQYEIFLLRHLFARAGSVPVSRNGRDPGAVRAALRRLHQGGLLCIFPEGEVNPGGIGQAQPGAALLALRSRAPVYPAFIAGGPRSHQLLRDWFWPSRGVRVVFGPPVDLSAYYGRPIDRALLKEVAALLMRRVADLQPVPEARTVCRGGKPR